MSRWTGSCTAARHQIHAYAGDGTLDHRGADRCGVCGLPQSNRLHKVPERSDEQREHEQRRMGENPDGATQRRSQLGDQPTSPP